MTEQLLQWYDSNARKLPWRENQDPYRIWLSEIMLQQTRVDTVVDYFQAWLKAFPSIESLALASEDQVLKQWQGLGYYRRARNFHKAAKIIVELYQSRFPTTAEAWRKLPGVGEYTAAAIASIASSQVIPVFDGNVIRVLTRICGIEQNPLQKQIKQQMLEQSMLWISHARPGDYNHAMMELGATICLPNTKPFCHICPVSSYCKICGTETWRIIPQRKEKTPRKIEKRTVFVIRLHQRILILKRPEQGLLGNLWELPNLVGYLTKQEVVNWCNEQNYVPITIKLVEKQFKHIFTHLEWHMKIWIIDLSISQENFKADWLDPNDSENDYAIPTAFKGILDWVSTFYEIN
ncbi:MAG: A/G-specific adenine glycosylase [Mobilitalea sp.]